MTKSNLRGGLHSQAKVDHQTNEEKHRRCDKNNERRVLLSMGGLVAWCGVSFVQTLDRLLLGSGRCLFRNRILCRLCRVKREAKRVSGEWWKHVQQKHQDKKDTQQPDRINNTIKSSNGEKRKTMYLRRGTRRLPGSLLV